MLGKTLLAFVMLGACHASHQLLTISKPSKGPSTKRDSRQSASRVSSSSKLPRDLLALLSRQQSVSKDDVASRSAHVESADANESNGHVSAGKTGKASKAANSDNGTRNSNNVSNDSDFVYVNLPLNEWTEFYFAEVGQLPFSRWQFTVPSNERCKLQVVDAYCTGDRFEAVSVTNAVPHNGRHRNRTVETPILATPPVPFDAKVAAQIRAGKNVNCTPYTTDPATAWSSSAWSKGERRLAAGDYRLILKPLLAPYGSGGAYVRVDCHAKDHIPRPYCSHGGSAIKLLNSQHPQSQLVTACSTLGLATLELTPENIAEARRVLLHCSGPNTQALVRSYNGDDYGGTVKLVLSVGDNEGIGSVTAMHEVAYPERILCVQPQ